MIISFSDIIICQLNSPLNFDPKNSFHHWMSLLLLLSVQIKWFLLGCCFALRMIFSGCLPTLATIPVWIGLYQALSNVANEVLSKLVDTIGIFIVIWYVITRDIMILIIWSRSYFKLLNRGCWLKDSSGFLLWEDLQRLQLDKVDQEFPGCSLLW